MVENTVALGNVSRPLELCVLRSMQGEVPPQAVANRVLGHQAAWAGCVNFGSFLVSASTLTCKQ